MGAKPGRQCKGDADDVKAVSPQQSLEALEEPLLRVPAGTGVMIFGDSWAEDNTSTSSGPLAGVQGWPGHLVQFLGLQLVGNFAKGQSESPSLLAQLETAKASFDPLEPPWSKVLVILHSGGNDFIGAEKGYNPFAQDNFWLQHCLWGFRRKAEEVISNLRIFLETLHALGCRRFLISDLPFTSAVPALKVARVAKVDKRGRWLNERVSEMLQDFCSSCKPGSVDVGHVQEVQTLNSLIASCDRRSKVRKMFQSDRFHPTDETHRLLAKAIATQVPVTDTDTDKEL